MKKIIIMKDIMRVQKGVESKKVKEIMVMKMMKVNIKIRISMKRKRMLMINKMNKNKKNLSGLKIRIAKYL